MKTIGMIGGMSWESTITYYQIMNRTVKEKLGGLHSSKCILYSVDFDEIERCQSEGRWFHCAALLSDAALVLEKAGADCIVLCTNTMHKVADAVQTATGIPFLHIAEMTADELDAQDIHRAGLLGTRYTMVEDFYKSRLTARGIEVLIPDDEGIDKVNDIIFHELCVGVVSEESKQYMRDQVKALCAAGAQGVILGCTELGLLLQQGDVECPLFDTAYIHARGAALFALE